MRLLNSGSLLILLLLPLTASGVGYHTFPDLSQLVPVNAPAGRYEYRVNVGPNQNVVVDSDQFDVLVVD